VNDEHARILWVNDKSSGTGSNGPVDAGGTAEETIVDEGIKETMSDAATWEHTRYELLLELAALPSEGDVLTWQRRLADAIIDSEYPRTGPDRAEAKRHRHLLRVIADGLVHELLPEHTIRSLSRHPGKPASLSSQGADFDFVFEQARALRGLGFIPLIADLTSLIGVGDIVGWNSDGIVVLECKNRPVPLREPTSGRLARQRHRGEQLETYLATSSVDEGDAVRQAHAMSLPSPDWAAVTNLIDRCGETASGVAVYELGPNDILVAAKSTADPERIITRAADFMESKSPTVVFYSDLINEATYRFMSPSSYPIGAEKRWRLLENKIRLIRLTDTSAFAAELIHKNTVINLVPEHSGGHLELRVDVDGQEYTKFTNQLAEFCLWMPVPLTAMRQTLMDYAVKLAEERTAGLPESEGGLDLAEGDHFFYRTVYRRE
jgi:hypothetical protein